MPKASIPSKPVHITLRVLAIILFVVCAYYFFIHPTPPRWTWAVLLSASALNLYLNISTSLNKK